MPPGRPLSNNVLSPMGVFVLGGIYFIDNYSVFQVACSEEIIMGVVLVRTCMHCCIHLKWVSFLVSFSSGHLQKQGQLPLFISSG